LEDSLRPDSLEGYIGQEHIKTPLAAALVSAKARKAAFPHMLVSGPPGLGKTTLALIIAKEMGGGLVQAVGTGMTSPKHVMYQLLVTSQRPFQVLFVDEVHRMRSPVQEALYIPMEDGMLLGSWGKKPMPPWTLIGATTDLGKLQQPFRDRFQVQFSLQFYGVEDLAEIAKKSAEKLGLVFEELALIELARRSRGTPRFVNNYLKWIRDFVIYDKVEGVIVKDTVQDILWDELRVDDMGLRDDDRRVLQALAGSSGSLGLDTLSNKVLMSDVTVQESIEPYLIYAGFMDREKWGRVITEKGRQWIENAR